MTMRHAVAIWGPLPWSGTSILCDRNEGRSPCEALPASQNKARLSVDTWVAHSVSSHWLQEPLG